MDPRLLEVLGMLVIGRAGNGMFLAPYMEFSLEFVCSIQTGPSNTCHLLLIHPQLELLHFWLIIMM